MMSITGISRRDRRAIVLGGGALAAILIFRFALMPWIESWVETRRSIAAADAGMDGLRRQVGKALVQRQWMVNTYGPGAAKPLQDAESAGVSLLAVKKILEANGFSPTTCRRYRDRTIPDVPAAAGARGAAVLVQLQFRGKCKLDQLAKCLGALKQAESLVFVDQLSVTNDPKKPDELDVILMLATLAEREVGS